MAAQTPRKRPVRKVAGTASNVLALDRQENVDRLAEREPLFSVDGVEYTIPKVVPASWTIQATNLAMTQGEAVALTYALLKMLGDDGFKALQDCETLTQEDLTLVTKIIADKVVPTKGDALPKGS